MPSQCRKSSRLWRWVHLMLPVALPLTLLVAAGAASAAPAAVADHVVISEVVSLETTDPRPGRPKCSDYVEIHNPTAAAIDLGQYYLTDATFENERSGLLAHHGSLAVGDDGRRRHL